MKGTLGWSEERKKRDEQFAKGHHGWAVEDILCTAGKEETDGKLGVELWSTVPPV